MIDSRVLGGVLVVETKDEMTAMVASAVDACGRSLQVAPNSILALEMLANDPFDLVIASSGAGGRFGVELAEQAAVHGADPSVLILTSSADALQLSRSLNGVGCDFLAQPFTSGELKKKISDIFARRSIRISAAVHASGTLEKLSQRFGFLAGSVASSLTVALSLTHRPTHEHCERVALRSAAVGYAMCAQDEEVRAIYLAGLLHDLGKVTVSAAVLDKPGPLDANEKAQVRSHPETAERIVSSVALPAVTMAAIRHHHEWFDGSGYPDGLMGEAIPFGARVISVCDAYDAMTTERPYKAAVAPEAAMERLAGASASQFDPGIVDVFCGLPEAIEV